jgi:glycogen debranching enzyme
MLLGAITRLNRATLNVTEPELRSQLSKACMNTLWLADSLIEKTIVAPNHLHKINALTNNLIAATAYAANPLGLREAEQLAKTTDVMIHRFQKSETLVLPEDRFASRYLSGMAMVLLTAAVITTMLLSTSLLPVAALLFISTAILPALLRLYVGSRAYYPEEGKAHCLRASLLGFFADKGLAQSAQALVPGPHFHRSYEQQAAYVPPPVRPGL